MTANNASGDSPEKEATEFKTFAAKRIVVGVVLTVVALWVFGSVLGMFDRKPAPPAGDQTPAAAHEAATLEPATETEATTPHAEPAHAAEADTHDITVAGHAETTPGHALDHASAEVELTEDAHSAADVREADAHGSDEPDVPDAHGPKPIQPAAEEAHTPAAAEKAHDTQAPAKKAAVAHAPAKAAAHEPAATASHDSGAAQKTETAAGGHDAATQEAEHAEADIEHKAKGVAFIEAVIKPMDYELNKRFYRWRPNDIIEIGDNVVSFQLGVLEVTRRTVVTLAERISRTGSTAAFDPNLENAMNWFMIKADEFWFPSAESKYNDALDELREYKTRLELGEANFHNRTDNLIPLLMAYEDLLGSCDENLVKSKEKDGREVKNADAYFFYAKGVASAMRIILEAIHHDFAEILEARRGSEVLHHAIESCHHAADIDPWIITDEDLSGIIANHRANMAAPISHARFYLGVLIKALST